MGAKGSKNHQSQTISDAEIAALKANTKLSEQEIRDMYEDFQRETGSGAGRMNKKQFRKYYKQAVGSDDKDGILADNTFAAFDANHDGSIDFNEFIFAIIAQNKTDIDSALEFSFKVMDTSGDEQISYNELTNYLEKAMTLAVGKEGAGTIKTDEFALGIYQMFGLNKTQKLNKHQFIDGCKKNENLAAMFIGSQ